MRETTLADYELRLEQHFLPYFADMPLDRTKFDVVEQYIAQKLAESASRAERLADWQRRCAAATGPAARRGLRKQRPAHPWSVRTINMTLTPMSAILGCAVERELIDRNPEKGKKRRIRESRPRRSCINSAEQIEAILKAAGEQDRAARLKSLHLRATLATFVFAGLRIGDCSTFAGATSTYRRAG